MTTAHSLIDVEVVWIRREARSLHYRSTRHPLEAGRHPDDLARHLGSASGQAAAGQAVCHSTSWRYDVGTVVLTYAALPDPCPFTAIAVADRWLW